MDYTFSDWKKTLEDFQNSVEKELKEIRKHKAEVQQIKAEILNELNHGRYIHDDHRIVISAPEVIIGNVDKSGTLLSEGGSTIILRGNHIGMDGIGETGSVRTRAASISQIAADPGVDGNEAVVGTVSEVISQARHITIQSNDGGNLFSIPPLGAGPGGICIHADGQLNIEASQSNEQKKTLIEQRIEDLEKEKGVYKGEAEKQKESVEKIFSDMEELMSMADSLRETDEDVRSNMTDLQQITQRIQALSPILYNAVDTYIQDLSVLAEANRQLTSLKEEKDKLPSDSDFKKRTTKAGINLRGERIDITSVDGDGNLRDNDEAGVDIVANKVKIAAQEGDGQLKENGEVHINAKTIGLSTANTKMKNDGKNGDVTAEGDIIITSKTVTLEAVDREIKDEKPEEKALTKDGKLAIRVETTNLSATDTEGKATGSVAVNSKKVQVKAMNVNKEKRTDDKMAEGSTMLLLAEKMYVGAKDKDNKSKKMQAVSEEVGFFADKTLEAQQGEAKAVLQLADGNASISGSKTHIYGETTINGKTEVKDEMKAPKATIDNLEAKSSFKSSNISDGIAVPGAPSSASLSAKMKIEPET